MTATTTPAGRLEDRYGRGPERRRRGRLLGVLGAVLVLAAAAVWGIWTGVGGAAATIETSTTGYVIHGDDRVTVGWTVSGEAGTPLVCAIEAQASDDTVVGLVEVRVPVTGNPARSGTTTVLTTRTADTGLIQSCRRA